MQNGASNFTGLGDLLLEQDRTETSVESTNALVLQHLAETSNKAIGICRLGNETDTGSLKRAKRDISEELSNTGRGEVNGCAVVGGSLETEDIDGLLLEQFITSELECALEEVSCGGGTETSKKSSSTLVCDDLSEASDQTAVVCDGIELDSCLDAIEDGCQYLIAPKASGQVANAEKMPQRRLTHRRE